jgi:hypothetical protein
VLRLRRKNWREMVRTITDLWIDELKMLYQMGWATLPGLRGLSCSGFRATPTTAPDNERGVAIEFANEAERAAFLQRLEDHFAARRFTNSADAFDTVKAYVLEHASKR